MDNPGASTKTAGEAAEGSKDKSGLYGWEGLEQHVLKDDKGKMDGYSKDIDTLLVFAGLFSAILSAFVVQTYPMLQPSPTSITNQLLAANNKMLVQGFSALLSQPIPSPSMFTLEDPAPFQVSTAAQWINCLFFVSLVLSLAAAMIGILVQQWIREYMQWNSALAQPRENILVRQFRFEAWESWNVSAVISTVPALLEIAMILFLVGMVILLWTLDSVVAICLTAVTISFLLVIAIFTVLPVFARRCPYKSPTAWAIILAWNSFHNSVMFAMQWCNNNILSRRWKYFCATLQGPGTSGAQYAIELPTLPGRQLLPASVTQPHIPRSMQPSFAILQPIGRFVQRLLKVVVMGVSDKHLRKRDPVIWVDPPLRWREFDIGNIHNTPINLGGHLSNSHIMRRIEDIIVQPIIDTIHWTNARAIEDLIIDTAEEYSMPLEMRNSMPDATSLSQSSKAHYISPLASLRELCIIFRALQWASKSSQSLHVIRYITQCAYALPANNPASWEQYWPVNLSSFLSVSNRVASGLVAQANAGIWQQYLLQHISIAASKAGVKGDELLPHYTLALEAYALTYDVQKGCLLVGSGGASSSDREQLLTHFFSPDPYKERNIKAYLITFEKWLDKGCIPSIPPDTADCVLTKAIDYVQCATRYHEDYHAEIVQLISQGLGELWEEECTHLRAHHGKLFRKLIHLLEDTYKSKMNFTNNTPDVISYVRRILHEKLVDSHKNEICEARACLWSGHPRASEDHDPDCHLLLTEEAAKKARARWRRLTLSITVVIRFRHSVQYSHRCRLRCTFWVAFAAVRLRHMMQSRRARALEAASSGDAFDNVLHSNIALVLGSDAYYEPEGAITRKERDKDIAELLLSAVARWTEESGQGFDADLLESDDEGMSLQEQA